MAEREPNHYRVLGVDPGADQATIRKAYHQAARRWHPDRNSSRDPAELARAESEMRRVNQAWEVLGWSESRRHYDRRLSDLSHTGYQTRAARPMADGQKPDRPGVIRVDPRLLDPDQVASRRYVQQADMAWRQSRILSLVPLAALVVLLAAIFVFTAYARSGSGPGPSTTVPGPQLGEGIEANDCVSILAGGALLERPCDDAASGRVIGARHLDGECPVGTVNEVTLANGLIVCLGLVR